MHRPGWNNALLALPLAAVVGAGLALPLGCGESADDRPIASTYTVPVRARADECTGSVELFGVPDDRSARFGSLEFVPDPNTGRFADHPGRSIYVRDAAAERTLRSGFESLGISLAESRSDETVWLGVASTAPDVDGVSYFLINMTRDGHTGSFVARLGDGPTRFFDLREIVGDASCALLDLTLDGRTDILCYDARGTLHANTVGDPDTPEAWRSVTRTVVEEGVEFDSGRLGGITRIVSPDGESQALFIGMHGGVDALFAYSAADETLEDVTPSADEVPDWWWNGADLTFGFMPWLGGSVVEALDDVLPALPYALEFGNDGPIVRRVEVHEILAGACNGMTRFEPVHGFLPQPLRDAFGSNPIADDITYLLGFGRANSDIMGSHRFVEPAGRELVAYTDAPKPLGVMADGPNGLFHTNGAYGFVTVHDAGAVNGSVQYFTAESPYAGTRTNGEFTMPFGWAVGPVPVAEMAHGRGGLGVLVTLGLREGYETNLGIYEDVFATAGYRLDLDADGRMDAGLAAPVVNIVANNGAYAALPPADVGVEPGRWSSYTNWQRADGQGPRLVLAGWDGRFQVYRLADPFETTALDLGGLPTGDIVTLSADDYLVRVPADSTVQYLAGGELEQTLVPHHAGPIIVDVTDAEGAVVHTDTIELPVSGTVRFTASGGAIAIHTVGG